MTNNLEKDERKIIFHAVATRGRSPLDVAAFISMAFIPIRPGLIPLSFLRETGTYAIDTEGGRALRRS